MFSRPELGSDPPIESDRESGRDKDSKKIILLREKKSPRLISSILEVMSIKFVSLITKVHRLDEGYTCVTKKRDFTEDPNEEIWGNQSFRVMEVLLRPLMLLLHFKR